MHRLWHDSNVIYLDKGAHSNWYELSQEEADYEKMAYVQYDVFTRYDENDRLLK